VSVTLWGPSGAPRLRERAYATARRPAHLSTVDAGSLSRVVLHLAFGMGGKLAGLPCASILYFPAVGARQPASRRGLPFPPAEDFMREFLASLLPVLLLAAGPTQAAPLTLGCSGTITTTQLPKDAVASDPEKENVADISVIVNFEQRTVSGLWLDKDASGRYFQKPLPIDAVDANSVSFRGRRGDKNSIQYSIEGTVDRITAKTDATETWLWPSGSLTTMVWDLRCRPTKPLF
jgi:hypothetical protein